MTKDPKDVHPKKRALVLNQTSSKSSFSTTTENPLDQSSINSDYPSDNLQLCPSRNDNTQNSNEIIGPPPFYTKRPTRKLPKMSKLKFLSKRKFYNTITIDNTKPVTPSMSHPSPPSFYHRSFSTFRHIIPVDYHFDLNNSKNSSFFNSNIQNAFHYNIYLSEIIFKFS